MPKNAQKNIISNEFQDEQFIDKIQHSLAVGSWEVNLKTNTLKWSEVTKKIHEVDSDYIPTLDTGINFYKEGKHREHITTLFNNAVENCEGFDDEFIIITVNGNEKWVRSIGYPILEDNKCVLVRGVFQDITEKTQKNIEITYKENLFRSFFEYSLTGLAIVGLKGQWLKVNKSTSNILGYTEAEFLETNFMSITHEEDRHIGFKEVKLMVNNELDNFQADKRYIHKDGSTVHCQISVSIVRDDNNKPLHFITNINNISKSKKAKAEIKNLLAISSKQNERLLNFAHIVSHNLRSHAGNLDMLIGLKKEDYPESTNNEYFPHIEKAVKNLNETISNLNEVAIQNIIEIENLKSINLLQFTTNAISNIKALRIANNANIEVFIDEKTSVKAIPAYLDSILINLLTNAIKYKSPDRDPEIELTVKQIDTYMVLEIADNGMGIDLDRHGKKLFGMYNVFHKNKDAKGIGLFISKNQIESIGGKIEVESTVGQGTKFKLFFKYE